MNDNHHCSPKDKKKQEMISEMSKIRELQRIIFDQMIL
jgi:hypothetical protein